MVSWGQTSNAEVSKETKAPSSSHGGEDWEEASEAWTSDEQQDHRSSSVDADWRGLLTVGGVSWGILVGVMTSTAFCSFLFALMICDAKRN